jgi:hypothetical protein
MPHPWVRLQPAHASPVLFGDMVWVDAPAEAMRRPIFGSTANYGREVTGVSLCDKTIVISARDSSEPSHHWVEMRYCFTNRLPLLPVVEA